MKVFAKNILLLAALITSCILYRLSDTPKHREFSGHVELSWREAADVCIPSGVYQSVKKQENSIGTWDAKNFNHTGTCTSTPFEAKGEILEIAKTGYPSPVEQNDITVTLNQERLSLPPSYIPGSGETWLLHSHQLKPGEQNSNLAIKLTDNNAEVHRSWIGLKNRVNFFNYKDPLAKLKDAVSHQPVKQFIFIIFSIVLTYAILQICHKEISNHLLFLLILFFCTLLQFQPDVFFYWDEWHAIERLHIEGPQEILKAHNEHFIPLFYGLYYLETLIFGDNYLLYHAVSIILFGLNTFFLAKLLSSISKYFNFSTNASVLLAVLFTLNSVNTEVFQWAFLHSVLAGQLCILLCAYCGWEFITTKNYKLLVSSALAALAGPMFFGGALISPIILGLLIIGLYILPSRLSSNKPFNKSILKLAAYVGFATALAATIYIFNQDGIGHGLDSKQMEKMTASPLKILNHLFVATHIGVIAGGLGLAPIDTDKIANRLREYEAFFDNEVFMGCIFLSALVVILIAGFWLIKNYGRSHVNFLLFIFLGEILIITSQVLPAIGRSHYGLSLALHLRYLYGGLPWLFLAALPIGDLVLSKVKQAQGKKSLMLSAFPILLYCMLHLHHLQYLDKYLKSGRENQEYITQLEDWKIKSLAQPGTEEIIPTFPPNLTPDMPPEQILRALGILNPTKYKSLAKS